jgi:hypothetical protein
VFSLSQHYGFDGVQLIAIGTELSYECFKVTSTTKLISYCYVVITRISSDCIEKVHIASPLKNLPQQGISILPLNYSSCLSLSELIKIILYGILLMGYIAVLFS